MPENVFQHDDGVVHHEADGQAPATRSVSVLMEKPSANISAKAPISETGIVTSGMSVARSERRKKKMISTTSTTASAMVL